MTDISRFLATIERMKGKVVERIFLFDFDVHSDVNYGLFTKLLGQIILKKVKIKPK